MGFFRKLFGMKKQKPSILDLNNKKENLLITYGKAYELSEDGIVIDYYKNINQVVVNNKDKFKSKTVYYNINKNGTFKKGKYKIKEWLRS